MLSNILKTVFIMSVSGGVFAAALMILSPLTRRLMNPRRHYYITLAAVMLFLIPLSFGTSDEKTPQPLIAQTTSTENSVGTTISESASLSENHKTEVEKNPYTESLFSKRLRDISRDAAPYAAAVWLTVTLILLCSKTEGYLWFIKRLSENSKAADVYDNIPERLRIRTTDMLQSPMITGLFRPTVYLPEDSLSASEKRLILEHELVHYRRGDIVFKWLIMAVKCIHWFNPIVYILSRYIERECEASCDFEATRTMSPTDKNRYMHTLVDMIERDTAVLSFGAQMSAEKSGLKLRIKAVKHHKSSRRGIRVVSALIAAATMLSGVYASGSVSKILHTQLAPFIEPVAVKAPPRRGGDSKQDIAESNGRDKTNDESEKNYSNDVQHDNSDNTDSNTLNNEPITQIISDNSISEQSSDMSIENRDNTEHITQENTDTDNSAKSGDTAAVRTDESATDRNLGAVLFGDNGAHGVWTLEYNGETPVIEGRYSSQNGCRASEKNLNFGESGRFYMYFKANMNTVMSIEIFDSKTHKSCEKFYLPIGDNRAYMFDGFDANRKYDIEIKSESGSDWRVEGVYYIY